MAALVQVPDMYFVAVLAAQQQVRDHAVFHHVGGSPFRRHHRVVSQMPPEVICKLLRTAALLPLPAQLEGVRIHQENTARSVSVGRAEGASIDAIRAAMNRVGRSVPGLPDELFGLDRLNDVWLLGVLFGIENVNARRSDAWHDQVAAFHMRMWRLRAKTRAAGVPAKMVQLIVPAGKIHLADKPSIRGRRRIKVDDSHGVAPSILSDIEQRDISKVFWWCLHCHAR